MKKIQKNIWIFQIWLKQLSTWEERPSLSVSVSTLPEWRSFSWVLTDKEESAEWTVDSSGSTYFSCVCRHQGQLSFRLSGGYSRFPPLVLAPEPDVKGQLHLVVMTEAQKGWWKHTRLGIVTVSLLSMCRQPKQVRRPTPKSREQERALYSALRVG